MYQSDSVYTSRSSLSNVLLELNL